MSNSTSRLLMSDKPVVIIGGLHAGERDRVRDFVLRLNAPAYAEPLSGLREDPALQSILLWNERMLSRGPFDSVIRIGNVPTLRFWRDLDETQRDIRIINYSALPFTGLSRGEVHSLDALPDCRPGARDDAFFARDRQMATELGRILDEEPRSEPAMFRKLSREIPRGARIYLGNSLPIREWDLAATREPRDFVIEASRGANGIDGQLSTFFGWCAPDADNWCIVGDLTALYDSNAPWIVSQLDVRFRIVIINNGGGRVFDRVASLRRMNRDVRERLVENAHALRFDRWAAMWGISDRFTELVPDRSATQRVWERYDALWA
jgi:2-succinyl-5-enolpyruvyl-6-hydroxy-3-cyclohexene-1-carboxylate synthase